MELIVLIFMGIVAGLLGGLLGISGGVITVPLLFFIFKAWHLEEANPMHLAIGTSLASMVFNSAASTWFHHRKKGVLWNIGFFMLPGIVLGSLAGVWIATDISETWLKLLFGVFACSIGIYFFFPEKKEVHDHPLPKKTTLNVVGFGIAFIANILGIGGSIFTAPYLMIHKVPPKKAIGTSAMTGFFITFLGALSYLYLGLSQVKAPETIGYLYLPAFITLSITTVLAAPFGVLLAHHLSTSILRKIFAFALIGTGISMLVK